jgi:hypothetical protein
MFTVYTAILNTKVLCICKIRGTYSCVAKAARLVENDAVSLDNKP